MGKLFEFDKDMRLEYRGLKELEYFGEDSIETELKIIGEDGKEAGVVWDNLTSAMYFIVSHGMKPWMEEIKVKEDLVLPASLDKELAGTEGTAIDGVTGRMILEGYRKTQGPFYLSITVKGDPSILEGQEF